VLTDEHAESLLQLEAHPNCRVLRRLAPQSSQGSRLVEGGTFNEARAIKLEFEVRDELLRYSKHPDNKVVKEV